MTSERTPTNPGSRKKRHAHDQLGPVLLGKQWWPGVSGQTGADVARAVGARGPSSRAGHLHARTQTPQPGQSRDDGDTSSTRY
jgi:hypothetical protein